MKVLIGVDPHKASLAVAAVDEAEGELLERAGFPQDRAGLSVLERWARRFPECRWAVQNAGGLGSHLAGRLAAAGESVVDGSCAWARSEVATESDAVAAPPRARRKEWIGFGVIAVPSLPLLDGSHRIGRRRASQEPRLPSRRCRRPSAFFTIRSGGDLRSAPGSRVTRAAASGVAERVGARTRPTIRSRRSNRSGARGLART